MKNLIIRLYGVYMNLLAVVAPSKAAEKGFLLFCKPFRVGITPKQKQFFNSAEKFTIKHEGEIIQGYRWGKGEQKILFLHGWQSHTYRWKAYIEALQNEGDYTIFALDAPGHGLSSGNFLSVPLYSSLIENFIRENGPIHTVVGHSLGGFSLLHTFHKYPLLQVNQLILLAPPGEASDFISVFRKSLRLNDRTMDLILDHFASRYDVTPDYFSTSRFIKSVNVRGLIIHDEEDAEAPYRYSVPLHKSWERSRLVTTKGFGHNLRSASVVKDVIDFINESRQEATSVQPLFSQQEK
ncbi:MAG TPA: alpha/beta hydrolase [Chryseosolibacter sp.]